MVVTVSSLLYIGYKELCLHGANLFWWFTCLSSLTPIQRQLDLLTDIDYLSLRLIKDKIPKWNMETLIPNIKTPMSHNETDFYRIFKKRNSDIKVSAFNIKIVKKNKILDIEGDYLTCHSRVSSRYSCIYADPVTSHITRAQYGVTYMCHIYICFQRVTLTTDFLFVL